MKTKPEMLTLDAHPSDAPCCIKLESDEGKSVLFQTDWDFPSLAGNFGFCLGSVQICRKCKRILTVQPDCHSFACHDCNDKVGQCCDHSGTDGTIDCPCGVKAGQFISAAREFLDEHDGEQCENPGYTLES